MKALFKYRFLYIIIALSLLASCSSSVRFSSDLQKSSKSEIVEKKKEKESDSKVALNDGPKTKTEKAIVAEAKTWMGTPYAWGGTTKRGVDCSGFVMNVYSSVGINLPRTAAEQYDYVQRINSDDKKAGDLVFFKKTAGISHVGIYIGNNEIIHSSSGRGVTIQSFEDPYLQSLYAGMGRPKKLNITKK